MLRVGSALLFLTLLCTFGLGDDPIHKYTDVHWMAPSEERWDEAQLDSGIKAYWTNEWSKAIYEPSCSDDRLKIVPVYFWPGERVDLNCAMCELAFLFNGKQKNWAKIDDIIEFAASPQSFVADPSKYRILQNEAWMENTLLEPPRTATENITDKMPVSTGPHMNSGTPEQKDPPAFIQRDGRLTILRTAPSVQGVYFCFDQESRPSTSLFYVLQAIVPPATLYRDKDVFTDGCTDEKGLVPMFNWKYHFIPAVRYERDEKCTDPQFNATSECQAGGPYVEINAQIGKETCDFDHCRADLKSRNNRLITDLNLAVELRWSEWSKCGDNRANQGREAHCYLVRKGGERIPTEDLTNELNWLPKLNDLLELPPFDKEGIRLYSSLIPSLIFDNKILLNSCKALNKDAERFEKFYREYILHAMGLQKRNGDPVLSGDKDNRRLETAFQACFSYQSSKSWELMVGTYMVETRPCKQP